MADLIQAGVTSAAREQDILDLRPGHGVQKLPGILGFMWRKLVTQGAWRVASRSALTALTKANLTATAAEAGVDEIRITVTNDDGSNNPRTYRWDSGSSRTAGANVLASGEGGAGRWIAISGDLGGKVEVYQTLPAAAGDRITNTDAATDFAAEYDISGAAAGDMYRIRAMVKLPSTNSTDTFALALSVGGIDDVGELAAYDAANDDVLTVEADVFVHAVGASGAISAAGRIVKDTGGTVTHTAFNVCAESVDFTAETVVIKLIGTWSAASASDQADLRVFRVERHLAP